MTKFAIVYLVIIKYSHEYKDWILPQRVFPSKEREDKTMRDVIKFRSLFTGQPSYLPEHSGPESVTWQLPSTLRHKTEYERTNPSNSCERRETLRLSKRESRLENLSFKCIHMLLCFTAAHCWLSRPGLVLVVFGVTLFWCNLKNVTVPLRS